MGYGLVLPRRGRVALAVVRRDDSRRSSHEIFHEIHLVLRIGSRRRALSRRIKRVLRDEELDLAVGDQDRCKEILRDQERK